MKAQLIALVLIGATNIYGAQVGSTTPALCAVSASPVLVGQETVSLGQESALASLDETIKKWRGFAERGGASAGMLERLEEKRKELENNGNDNRAPKCYFSVLVTKSGAKHKRVNLGQFSFFDYKDPKTGKESSVSKLRFSNDQKNWREYPPTKKKILWTLGESNDKGEYKIYMQAKDNSGNWGNGSEKAYSQTISLP